MVVQDIQHWKMFQDLRNTPSPEHNKIIILCVLQKNFTLSSDVMMLLSLMFSSHLRRLTVQMLAMLLGPGPPVRRVAPHNQPLDLVSVQTRFVSLAKHNPGHKIRVFFIVLLLFTWPRSRWSCPGWSWCPSPCPWEPPAGWWAHHWNFERGQHQTPRLAVSGSDHCGP